METTPALTADQVTAPASVPPRRRRLRRAAHGRRRALAVAGATVVGAASGASADTSAAARSFGMQCSAQYGWSGRTTRNISVATTANQTVYWIGHAAAVRRRAVGAGADVVVVHRRVERDRPQGARVLRPAVLLRHQHLDGHGRGARAGPGLHRPRGRLLPDRRDLLGRTGRRRRRTGTTWTAQRRRSGATPESSVRCSQQPPFGRLLRVAGRTGAHGSACAVAGPTSLLVIELARCRCVSMPRRLLGARRWSHARRRTSRSGCSGRDAGAGLVGDGRAGVGQVDGGRPAGPPLRPRACTSAAGSSTAGSCRAGCTSTVPTRPRPAGSSTSVTASRPGPPTSTPPPASPPSSRTTSTATT